MSRNDQAVTALETLTGQTGNYNDLILAWLQDNGATSGDICDAWGEYLDGQAISDGCLNDRWYEWLTGLGYSGALADMFYAMWAAGGPGGVTLAFHALTYDETTYEMLGVKTGTGSLTTTHAQALYAPDKDGVYQKFPANAPVWAGGRCVLTGGAGSDVAAVYADNGSGTLLPSLPYLQYYPAATQSQKYSNDLTNAEWTATNVTVAKDATGIDGVASNACTLTSTAANGTVIANAITAASATHSTCWYLKRVTGTGNIDITLDNGSTWTTVTLTSDFQKFTVDQATLANPQIGIRIVTSGDAVIVGNAECHTAKAESQVRGLGPIFTTSAAASTDATDYVWDNGNVNYSEAAWFAEYFQTGGVGDNTYQDVALSITNTTSSNNLWICRSFGLVNATGGGGNDNLQGVAGTITTEDTQHKLGNVYSVTQGEWTVNADGNWDADASNSFVGFEGVFGKELTLHPDAPPNASAFKLRNLRRYDISSYQDGKDKIDELMA